MFHGIIKIVKHIAQESQSKGQSKILNIDFYILNYYHILWI